jgi:hypothetical protein
MWAGADQSPSDLSAAFLSSRKDSKVKMGQKHISKAGFRYGIACPRGQLSLPKQAGRII